MPMKISPGCVEILLSLVWWFATQQTTNTLHSSSPFKEKNIRIPQKKYPEVVRVLADVTLS